MKLLSFRILIGLNNERFLNKFSNQIFISLKNKNLFNQNKKYFSKQISCVYNQTNHLCTFNSFKSENSFFNLENKRFQLMNINSTFKQNNLNPSRNFFSFSLPSVEEIIYDDRRIIGYTAEQIYNIVEKVEEYKFFFPHIRDSIITSERTLVPGSSNLQQMRAILKVQFATYEEQYESQVILEKNNLVIAKAIENHLIKSLDNEWRLTPTKNGKATIIDFSIRFKFVNPLVQMAASSVMPSVVDQMSKSFEERCRAIYGDPAYITELCETPNSARRHL